MKASPLNAKIYNKPAIELRNFVMFSSLVWKLSSTDQFSRKEYFSWVNCYTLTAVFRIYQRISNNYLMSGNCPF